MIRAGRLKWVRTLDDIAKAQGYKSTKAFRNTGRHRAPQHPAPISGPLETRGRAKTLYDGEQTDAYYRGDPVPELTGAEDPDDLLNREEAAAEAGVPVDTWSRYDDLPGLRPLPKPVKVKGVTFYRRGDIRAWREDKEIYRGGRPTGTANLVPVEEIAPRTAALLADNPVIRAEEVADEIGLGIDAAQRALAAARADGIEQLLERRPGLSEQQIADELGYPLLPVRRALPAVAARSRARALEPYLTHVIHGLDEAGISTAAHRVKVRPKNVVAAALKLSAAAPAPYLLWDERYGWRTSPARPNLDRGERIPPQGSGIRYLDKAGRQPSGQALAELLKDSRTGRGKPAEFAESPGTA
ncbi:hypothetical protein [Streptomyces nanshensis]|uniref:hypothetical protein n=1 Tax=Streptomyces nanshensis TaxID=518642 RepID=UPI00085C3669|nr:hypothetical protein [Streptomyces nanshensis]